MYKKKRKIKRFTKVRCYRDAAQDSILDNQLLDGIRLWLEPLPDRSLPSLDIQNSMLDILNTVSLEI